uniref:Capsid protein n=1 Tax=Pittosporum tobira parvo-like virus TaxID=2739860 RepID=A0A6M9BKE9_9VIRU|nr:Hypothetical protein 3 [Pittosporum tobira parvo-like virus]
MPKAKKERIAGSFPLKHNNQWVRDTQLEIASAYKAQRNLPNSLKYQEFLKSDAAKQIRTKIKDDYFRRRLAANDNPDGNNLDDPEDTVARPPTDAPVSAGSSGELPNNAAASNTNLDNSSSGISANSGNSGMDKGTGGYNESMDVDRAGVAGEAAHSGAPSTSHRNGGGPLAIMYALPSSKPVSFTFKKRYLFWAHAFPYSMQSGGKEKYPDCLITNLNVIPVDWVPFYLNDAEYDQIHMSSRVTKVTCDVTILGTRSGFDTGTTLSGSATTEYIPLGRLGIGLNTKFPMRQGKVNLNDKFIPTGIQTTPHTTLYNVLHDFNGATQVPRHWPLYCGFEYENTPGLLDKEVLGPPNMNEHTQTLIINNCINKNICHYEYKPRNGVLHQPKLPVIMNYQHPGSDAVVYNSYDSANTLMYPLQFEIDTFRRIRATPHIKEKLDHRWVSRHSDYNAINEPIDKLLHYSPHGGVTGSLVAQPTIALGMMAIPQNNPATENTTYLNASMYYMVETSIDIERHISSAYQKLGNVADHSQISMERYPLMDHTNSGRTQFGMHLDSSTRNDFKPNTTLDVPPALNTRSRRAAMASSNSSTVVITKSKRSGISVESDCDLEDYGIIERELSGATIS